MTKEEKKMADTTEISTQPTEPIDDGFSLSIDRPVENTSTFQPTDYDGAEPSATPAPEAPPAGPKKLLRIDMGDGKYYTAETERELLQKVVDGKKEADRYINELKTLKAGAQPTATNVTIQPKTPMYTGDLPEKYDHQTYLNMITEDPIKAQRYINREIYGADPVEMLRHASTVSTKVEQQLIGAEFKRRNPDFPANEGSVDVVVDMMRRNNLPYNLVNLEWSYNEAKRQGRLNPGAATPEGEIEYEDISFGAPQQTAVPQPMKTATVAATPVAPAGHQRRGAGAPRTPGNGTGVTPVVGEADPYSMPLEELRKQIESKGLRR
jgi:hypothetical protein